MPAGLALEAILGAPQSLGALGLSMFLLIFVLTFGIRSEALTALAWRGPAGATQGEVLEVQSTSSKENSKRIHEVRYRYTAGGRTLTGESYGFSALRALPKGAPVTVEYLEQRPEVSRVQGLRRHPFSAFLGLALVPWALALLGALGGIPQGFARLRLLREGRLAWARLIGREEERRGKVLMHRLTFEYALDEGGPSYRTSAVRKTHTVEENNPGPLVDDPEEALLCAPGEEGPVVFLDQLPAGTTVDEQGNFQAPFAVARFALILWALTSGIALVIALYLGHVAFG